MAKKYKSIPKHHFEENPNWSPALSAENLQRISDGLDPLDKMPAPTAPAPKQKGIGDYVSGALKGAYDIWQRSSNALRSTHLQALKNEQGDTPLEIAKNDLIHPNFGSLITAAKEGYNKKRITTGANIANEVLKNKGGVKKNPVLGTVVGQSAELMDDPLAIIPIGASEKLVGEGLAKTGLKLSPKILGSPLGQTAIKGLGTGLGYGAFEGAGQGKSAKDTAINAAKQGALFTGFGVGGYGLSKLVPKLTPVLTAGAETAEKPALSLPEPKIKGTLPEPKIKGSLEDTSGKFTADNSGNVYTSKGTSQPTRLFGGLTNSELQMSGDFYLNKYKQAGDKASLDALNSINGEIKYRENNAPSAQKYTLKPKYDVKQTENALNGAIEKMQNEAGHWDIPQGSEELAKKLGIDFPTLIGNYEQALNPPKVASVLGEKANLANWKRVTGISDVPNLSKISLPGVLKAREIPNQIEIPELKPKLNVKNARIRPEIKPDNVNIPESVASTTLKPETLNKTTPSIDKLLGITKNTEPKVAQYRREFYKQYGLDPRTITDISLRDAKNVDFYRNIERLFGKESTVTNKLIGVLDKGKSGYVNELKAGTDKLYNDIVKNLGIKKNSKEAALVQKYGEKGVRYFDRKTGKEVVEPYTLEDLKIDAPKDWQKIKQASDWFRREYDNYVDRVNEQIKQIYPTTWEKKLVPKREDYFRHTKELGGLEGIKNLFIDPANIDPTLVGMSEYTQPKTAWQSFKQKRGLGEYKLDAVGGMLDYLPQASRSIHIDPIIPEIRNFNKQLAWGTKDTANANNLIKYLSNYANDLAGKTSPYLDRGVMEFIGRKPLKVVSYLTNRMKSNAILGNARSTMSQLANIPNGIAYAKQYSAPGLTDSVKMITDKSAPIYESPFIKERFSGELFRKFDNRIIDQPRKMAEWLMETSDRIGTSFIWNSSYRKGLAEGATNPIKYADDVTRKLVAGRGIGELPLIQRSKIYQLIAPFQVEVANLWQVQKDMVKAKDFTGLATLYLTMYLFNKGAEKTTGSGITFDPIKAIEDAFNEKDVTPMQRVGRLGGEILSNVPMGQQIAAALPEETRKKYFGRNDPTRFGVSPLVVKGLQDPLYNLLPNFGGKQIQKTVSGYKALQNKGVYNDKETQLKYPVKQSSGNIAKGLLFGASAFPESQQYYNENRKPLSEKQTNEYKSGNTTYDQLMKQRKINKLKAEMSKTKKDRTLTNNERQKRLEKLYQEYKKAK